LFEVLGWAKNTMGLRKLPKELLMRHFDKLLIAKATSHTPHCREGSRSKMARFAM
jgi:hypothetical protein